MDFSVQKAENCFADAENYEYRLSANGADLLAAILDSNLVATSRINDRLRRPTFSVKLNDGTQIKGLLAKDVIKVGYPPADAAKARADLEDWLTNWV
ncbi:MAG: hypothetical protein LBR39_05475 [Coriobacteriales bacterium]|jgi:hypothetical protein|nr:hypothetical protein [Coriobacteriales bacterium]